MNSHNHSPDREILRQHGLDVDFIMRMERMILEDDFNSINEEVRFHMDNPPLIFKSIYGEHYYSFGDGIRGLDGV